ncbi:MAG: hypothetical protein ACT4N2_15130 [Hyphomicrobium sp.]
MSQIRATRGRPKGTGLDDHEQLISVARKMASDPNLKTTTAIRSTGITDPSSIRRLRDKFNDVREQLMAEVAGTPSTASRPPVAVPSTAARRHTAAALTKPTASRKTAEAKSATSLPSETAQGTSSVGIDPPTVPAVDVATPVTSQRGISPNDATWMTIWCGLGIQSFSTAVALQISFVEKMMRMPHMASALRGQVALNELALAFTPKSDGLDQRTGETLH